MDKTHMDQDVAHGSGQQKTGNYRKPEAAGGSDRLGGTRAGAKHVEQPALTNIEKGTDVDRVAGLEANLDDSVSVQGPAERAPERVERGRT